MLKALMVQDSERSSEYVGLAEGDSGTLRALRTLERIGLSPESVTIFQETRPGSGVPYTFRIKARPSRVPRLFRWAFPAEFTMVPVHVTTADAETVRMESLGWKTLSRTTLLTGLDVAMNRPPSVTQLWFRRRRFRMG